MAVELNHKIVNLHAHCWVNQKLPKTFFKRNFEITLSEKKLLDDFSIIQQMEVLALVNQETANIPSFTEASKTFLNLINLWIK